MVGIQKRKRFYRIILLLEELKPCNSSIISLTCNNNNDEVAMDLYDQQIVTWEKGTKFYVL
jgi:hypothetical protein